MNYRLRAGLVVGALFVAAAPLAAWAHQWPSGRGDQFRTGSYAAHAGLGTAHGGHHHYFGRRSMQQCMDEYLARLHGGLHLSAKQAHAWNSFVNVIKTQVLAMADHSAPYKEHGDNKGRMSAPDRLDAKVQVVQAHLDALRALDRVTKALYMQLSPTQQTIFNLEASHLGRAGSGF